MRAGTETALARVVAVFGEARAHHAYLFANRRCQPHQGAGARRHRHLAVRAPTASRPLRLGECRVGPAADDQHEQLQALVIGLPWCRIGAQRDDSRGLKLLLFVRVRAVAASKRMQVHDQLAAMDAQQLREFAAGLIERVARQDQELRCKQLKIDQLTHEMAVLRRWKFAARSEQLHGEQRHLFDETVDGRSRGDRAGARGAESRK